METEHRDGGVWRVQREKVNGGKQEASHTCSDLKKNVHRCFAFGSRSSFRQTMVDNLTGSGVRINDKN